MHNRVIFAALVLLLLAGCTAEKSAPTVERVRVVTATPAANYAAIQPEPTVTLFDPNARAREAVNNAAMLAATVTAEAQNAVATQIAFDRAQAEATGAALALTQQVEQANAQATQHAISVAATATTAAIALQRQQADMTATAQALGLADAVATQEAARANELRIEVQETERRASQADLDRQTWYVVKLALGLAALALGLMAGWQIIRLLSVYVAIKARRMLVLEQAGLFIDAQTGRPEALPAYTPAPALEQPDQLERLQAAINPELREDALRASDRELRRAWRTMALHFLRWSEYTPKGEDTPVGFSRRRLCAAANVTRDTYETMIAFLADLGLIQKETDHPRAPWVLTRGSDGRPMTVSQALRHTVWLTSFETPDVPSLPLIYAPPQNARPGPSHPIPPTPTQPSPHPPTKNGGKTAQNTGWNLSLPPESLGDIDGEDVVETG